MLMLLAPDEPLRLLSVFHSHLTVCSASGHLFAPEHFRATIEGRIKYTCIIYYQRDHTLDVFKRLKILDVFTFRFIELFTCKGKAFLLKFGKTI